MLSFLSGLVASPLILLAEDNEGSLQSACQYLQSQNYRVVIARNFLEVETVLQQEKPDLIIMDLQQANNQGLDGILALRQHQDWMKIPIIAMTALTRPVEQAKYLKMGANDCLIKPVSFPKLLTKIKAYLK